MNKITRNLAIILLSIFVSAPAAAQEAGIDRSVVMDYMQMQQYGDALQYILPRYDSNSVKDLNLLAYTYYVNGQTNISRNTYQQVLHLDSSNIQALQYIALIYSNNEEFERAVDYYQKLVEINPANYYYYKQMGSIYSKLQQPDSAFANYQTAYQLNNKDARVVSALADILIDKKDYKYADSILNQYLFTDSSQLSIINVAIRSAYNQKDMKRVVSFGDVLVNLHIVSPSAFQYVAVANYYLKEYKDCIKTFEYLEYFKTAPALVKYYAALSYTELHDYDKSNELLLACIEETKSDALGNYYSALGNNFNQMKQYRTAIKQFDTAYYMNRGTYTPYAIATIYDSKMNLPKAAKRYYQLYLKEANNSEDRNAEVDKYVRERLKQIAQ